MNANKTKLTRSQTRWLALLSLMLVALLVGSAVILTNRPSEWAVVSVPTQAVLPSVTPTTVLATATPLDPEPQVVALDPAPIVPVNDAPPPAEPVQAAAAATNTVVPPTLVPTVVIPASVPSGSAPIVEIPREPVPQQIVIHFAPDASDADRAAYIAQIGGAVVDEIDALDTVIVEVDESITSETLPEAPAVAASEPDYLVSAQIEFDLNDPFYGEQWALPAVGAAQAWAALPADAPSVTVAVIDSGVCADHPDLQGRILDGYDFVNNDTHPDDDFGHGCAVSGIIAANVGNGVGIAGIAPNARILPLKALDASGLGRYSDVAAAIVYAVDHDAQIINLSLGGAFESTTLRAAIDYALAQDATVIAAAGNTGGTVLFPASYAPVIAVGAVDRNLDVSSFSARGDGVDVWAPGSDIFATSRDGYAALSGTSFAAPYVAGALAVDRVRGNLLAFDHNLLAFTNAALPPAPPVEITATPALPPQQITGLFSDTDKTAAMDVSSQLGVTRTRYVDVNLALLTGSAQAAEHSGAAGTTALELNLFDDVVLTADQDRIEPHSVFDDGFVWVGHVRGSEASEVILVAADGQVEGHVLTVTGFYQITYAGNGVHAINAINLAAFYERHVESPTVEPPPDFTPEPEPDVDAQAAGQPIIDVMVVYTAEARDYAGSTTGIANQIQQAITATNQAYINSLINQRLNLVYTGLVDYNENGQTDLDRLGGSGDGYMDNVHALRNQYRADLVALITDDTVNYCGIGYLMSPSGSYFESWAFSITTMSCLPGGMVFAHELGHNMGSHHDAANTGGATGAYSYSYGYQDPDYVFRTIMAYDCDDYWGCPRINYFSNVTETYSGRSMGHSTANNALSLNNTAAVVAAFRAAPPAKPTNWRVNTSSLNSITLAWNDNAHDESGFRVYRWNGASFVQRAQVSANVTTYTDSNLTCGTTYYYQVSAYNGTGESARYETEWIAGTTLPCPPTNDAFSSASAITTLPYTGNVNVEGATTATSDPVPSCAGDVYNTVWYRYTPSADQKVRFHTDGSDYDTVLSIWTGTQSNLTPVACNDDGGDGFASEIELRARAGTTYYIMVSSYDDYAGSLEFTAEVNNSLCDITPIEDSAASLIAAINTANADTFPDVICMPFASHYTLTSVNNTTSGPNALPVITTPITLVGRWATIQRGSGAPAMRLFNIGSGGSLHVSELIVRDGFLTGSDSGAAFYNNGSLTVEKSCIVGNLAAEGGGIYNNASSSVTADSNWWGHASGPSGNAFGSGDSISQRVNATQFTTQQPLIYLDRDYHWMTCPALNPPANDRLANTINIGSVPYSYSQNAQGSTVNFNEPSMSCAAQRSNTVWFRYVAAGSQWLEINTAGSSYDTAVAVYSADYSGSYAGFNERGCNDQNGGSAQASLIFPTTPGTSYFIGVARVGTSPVTGALTLVLNMNTTTPTLTAPVPLAPADTTATTLRQPVFSWSSVAGATGYELVLGRTSTPSEALYSGSLTSFTPTQPLLYGVYYWRVRALYGGSTSDWSATYSFSIVSPSNAVPGLNLHTTSSPTLTWSAITWAVSYEIVIATDTRFTRVVLQNSSLPSETRWLTPSALPRGTYYWHVRALLPDGKWGAWSATDTFTVDP